MVPDTGTESNQFELNIECLSTKDDEHFVGFDETHSADVDALFDVLQDWNHVLESLPNDSSEPQS